MDPRLCKQGLPGGAAADIVVAAGDRVQCGSPGVVGDGTGVFASLVAVHQTILSDTTGYPACQ